MTIKLQDSPLFSNENITDLPRQNTKPLSKWQCKPFDTEALIQALDAVEPGTGRVKALALLHSFPRGYAQYIPGEETAKRILRNENIFKKWRNGESYNKIAQELGMKEKWVRAIVSIMLTNGKIKS